jgi:hypothetical protein
MQRANTDSDFPETLIAAATALQLGDTATVTIDGGERSHEWLPQSPTGRVVSREVLEVYPLQPDRSGKQFDIKFQCGDAVDSPITNPYDADFRITVRERRGKWYAIELYAPVEPDLFTRITRNSISAFNDDEDIGSILDITIEDSEEQDRQPSQDSSGESQRSDSSTRTTECRRCGEDAEKFDQVPVESVDDDCLGKFRCPDGHVTVR